MADEKIVVINLRKYMVKKPKWFRSSLAIKILREELEKKTKVKKIKLDKKLNEILWKKGIEKPVMKVKVKITKVDEKTVKAELV